MKTLKSLQWSVTIAALCFQTTISVAQQPKQGQQSKLNFYQVRETMLKEMESAKAKNVLNEDNKFEDNSYKKFKRWEHFVEPRVFPTGEFYAPDAVYKEYVNYYSSPLHKSSSQTSTWEAVGPFYDVPNSTQLVKTGVGRMNCIAQHPTDTSILYIGTMGGGIWKTLDGGSSWISLNDNLPSMSFSDIAINPNYPDTIYAATGDAVGNFTVLLAPQFHQGHYSAGILMSPDGGATWMPTGFTFQQFEIENIYRLVIDPVNPNNLMVGSETGLFRSTDAGVTWIQLDTTLTIDIKINPLDPQKYYAMTENGLRMKRSYDGGATWVATNAAPLPGGVGLSRIGISAADTSKIYVIRGFGRLFKTINGGTTFTTVSTPGNVFVHQGDYDKAIAVSPTNVDVMLLGFVLLIKTTNGGVNFAVIDSMNSYNYGPHVDFHSLEFSFNNPNKVYALNDGGFYVSYDEGMSWTSLNHGINATQYYDMGSSFLNPDFILAGAQDNQTHLFDGTNFTFVTCCDGMDCSFDYTDETIAYASVQNGVVYRSGDGGNNFPTQITPPGFTGNWETPHLINPINSKTIYMAGSRVYKSHNRGDTWVNFSPLLDNSTFLTSLAQSPADTNVIYTSSFGQLWITTDNGVSWIDRTAGLPITQSSIYGITVSHNNALVAYVTLAGFSPGEKVYKTTDGGLNWVNISGTLPNIPCNVLVAQKNTTQNDLYVGTDFGVFYYNDSIANWNPYNNGLPGVIISDMELNYRSGKLFVATHGRGIYKVDPITPIIPILTDASILKIASPAPVGYCDSLTASLIVQVKNYGTNILNSVDINYSIDGGSVTTIPWTGSLPTYGISSDTLTTITLYGGAHVIDAFTSNPNGITDEDISNDAKQSNIYISTAVAAFPFTEGFENAFPPTDWNSAGNIWFQDGPGGFGASNFSAMANFWLVQTGTGYLSSMRVDLTAATPSTFLGFAHAYARFDSTAYIDTLRITVSNDCSLTWDTIYAKSNTALATVPGLVLQAFVPAVGDWVYNYIDISSYVGQVIKVQFEGISGWGNDLFVDDINIFHGVTEVENYSEQLLKVYPNPTNSMLYFDDPAKIITHVEIFNQQGQLVKSLNAKSVGDPLQLDSWSQQIYYVKMHTEKGVITKKVTLIK